MTTQAEKEFIYYKRGTAGSFRSSLYETYFKGDEMNQAKLESVFPDLSVLRRYCREKGYWEDLQSRFKDELNVSSRIKRAEEIFGKEVVSEVIEMVNLSDPDSAYSAYQDQDMEDHSGCVDFLYFD